MISISEFIQYKEKNFDSLKEIEDFYLSIRNKQKNYKNAYQTNIQKEKNYNIQQGKYKKPDNWILNEKNNQTTEEKKISQIKSLLNKISHNNYDTIMDSINNMSFDNHQVNDIIEMVINKAIMECKYTNIYSKILEKYFNNNKDQVEQKILNLMDFCKDDKIKIMGKMNLLGELFLINIIQISKIKDFLDGTLLDMEESDEINSVLLEGICLLIHKIKSIYKDYDEIMIRMQKLMGKKTISKKDKFIIQDLIEKN